MWHAARRVPRTRWLPPAGRQAARRIRGRLAGWRAGYVARVPFSSRTLVWITAAICAVLLVSTGSEAWVNFQLQRQIHQAQVQNAQLRQDILTTQRRAAWAESPGTIEDEARAIGYIRPGEQAVVVAANPPAPPAAAPAPPPVAPASRGSTAREDEWWQLFFGG